MSNEILKGVTPWVVEYNNDVCPGFVEWWNVQNEAKEIVYRAYTEIQAQELCDILNNIEALLELKEAAEELNHQFTGLNELPPDLRRIYRETGMQKILNKLN